MFIWMEWWRQIGPSGEWQYFAFSDVFFLWLRGEHITLQPNEISGLLLSFDSIGKCQIRLALRCFSKHLNSPSVSIKFKIPMQSTVYFFSSPFLFWMFYSKKVLYAAQQQQKPAFLQWRRRWQKLFIITLCGRASGLTHLLDEVIKTNMMD